VNRNYENLSNGCPDLHGQALGHTYPNPSIWVVVYAMKVRGHVRNVCAERKFTYDLQILANAA